MLAGKVEGGGGLLAVDVEGVVVRESVQKYGSGEGEKEVGSIGKQWLGLSSESGCHRIGKDDL